MARFPRTLADALAAQAEAGRSTRTEALSVDALAPIGVDQLTPELTERIDTIDTVVVDLERVDDKIANAISEFSSIPITWEKFNEDELSIWPFINAIPRKAIAPGTITAVELDDFAVTAVKIHDGRHRIY